jgi:hypothetical protein
VVVTLEVCADADAKIVVARSVDEPSAGEEVCVGIYAMRGFVELMSVSACKPTALQADNRAPTKPTLCYSAVRILAWLQNSLDCASVAHDAVMHGRRPPLSRRSTHGVCLHTQ